MTHLLLDGEAARHLGRNGRETVVERYLVPSYLESYLALIASLIARG